MNPSLAELEVELEAQFELGVHGHGSEMRDPWKIADFGRLPSPLGSRTGFILILIT